MGMRKENMNSLFTVIFNDNSMYEGGKDLFSPKWSGVPQNKQIRSLFVSLPSGDNLILSGYDKYYYRIEGCQDLNGKNAGQLRPKFIFVYAQKEKDLQVL